METERDTDIHTDTKTYEQVLEENGYLCWKTVGVSMQPLIREGRDVIVIRTIEGPLHRNDVVLYRRPTVTGRGAYVLHRILRIHDDGTYWIVGDNCVSGETVRREDILGVLSGLTRDGRPVNLEGMAYRLYVRLWCDSYPVRFFLLRCRSAAGTLLRRRTF